MTDTIGHNQTKFKALPLSKFKTVDLIYVLLHSKDDNKITEIWDILKTRTLDSDTLKRVAFHSNNDTASMEAYDMYIASNEAEYYTVYYITNTQVAIKAANNYLKQKSLSQYDIRKILFECRNEKLAMVFFKAYCKRFSKDNDFDEFLVDNINEGWCSQRHNSVGLLAFKKLKQRQQLTIANLTSIILNGYYEPVKVKAALELVLIPELNFDKLYCVFSQSKSEDVINVLIDKFFELYTTSQKAHKHQLIQNLLISKNNYSFSNHAVRMWDLIQYCPFEYNDAIILLTKTTHDVVPLVWNRFKDLVKFSSYNYYTIKKECCNSHVAYAATKEFINHPDTSIQSITHLIESNWNINAELAILILSKLKAPEVSAQTYKYNLFKVIQAGITLNDELENEIMDNIINDRIDEKYLLPIATTSNSDSISKAAFNAFCKKLQLTKPILVDLIVSCKNLKLKTFCQKLLFKDFASEITEDTLKVLLNVNNEKFRNHFLKIYLNHEDVDYYDIESMAKYSESYTLKQLALEVLQTPYFLSIQSLTEV